MADASATTSLPAATESAAPTSEYSLKDLRLSVSVLANEATRTSLKDFVSKHSRDDTTEADAATGDPKDQADESKNSKTQLTDERTFREELQLIVTSASWDPTVIIKYSRADGKTVKMPHVVLSEDDANTADGWRQTAATSLSNWRMKDRRASNLSKQLYDLYSQNGGSIDFGTCNDKVHKSAAGGARFSARKSLPSEAEYTMPRKRKTKAPRKSVGSVEESELSDSDSVAAGSAESGAE